jgi:hypothetical protein
MPARRYVDDETGASGRVRADGHIEISEQPRQAWYSPDEAAAVWRVYVATVVGWCWGGKLGDNAVQLGGRNGVWRIRGSFVERGSAERGGRVGFDHRGRVKTG